MTKKRSVVIAIILSIITFGLYGLYWFVCLTDDSNKLSNVKTAGGITALVFTILTFGIYQYYWFYMIGRKIEMYDHSSNGIVHFLLGFFGFGIISYIIAQLTINRFVDEKNKN